MVLFLPIYFLNIFELKKYISYFLVMLIIIILIIIFFCAPQAIVWQTYTNNGWQSAANFDFCLIVSYLLESRLEPYNSTGQRRVHLSKIAVGIGFGFSFWLPQPAMLLF